MTMTVPSRIPWPLHRVATSGHYRDSLADISERWSLADVVDAWELCDILDDARVRAQKAGDG